MAGEKFAAKPLIGAVTGVLTGLKDKSAPHLAGFGQGIVNTSATFFNAAASAAKHHKGIAGAVGAGSTAVLAGHPIAAAAVASVAPVVVAAAPIVAAVAVVGGAGYGGYKLIEHIESKL